MRTVNKVLEDPSTQIIHNLQRAQNYIIMRDDHTSSPTISPSVDAAALEWLVTATTAAVNVIDDDDDEHCWNADQNLLMTAESLKQQLNVALRVLQYLAAHPKKATARTLRKHTRQVLWSLEATIVEVLMGDQHLEEVLDCIRLKNKCPVCMVRVLNTKQDYALLSAVEVIKHGHSEADDKLQEGSSGACNTSAVHQRSAAASEEGADSVPSEVSGAVKSVRYQQNCQVQSEVLGTNMDVEVKPGRRQKLLFLQLQKIKTSMFKVIFYSNTLPPYVRIGYQQYRVNTYIEKPWQYYKCQRFGHSAAFYRSAPRCVVCSGPHTSNECNKTTRRNYCNCDGNHTVNYGGCPKMKQAKEVEKTRQIQKLSYRDAVKEVLKQTATPTSQPQSVLPTNTTLSRHQPDSCNLQSPKTPKTKAVGTQTIDELQTPAQKHVTINQLLDLPIRIFIAASQKDVHMDAPEMVHKIAAETFQLQSLHVPSGNSQQPLDQSQRSNIISQKTIEEISRILPPMDITPSPVIGRTNPHKKKTSTILGLRLKIQLENSITTIQPHKILLALNSPIKRQIGYTKRTKYISVELQKCSQ
ncbi:hypothetical protein FHG87_019199 [Trinorchestia longiramus]|nr:hypothetical protein FHG87_019199 [Trinorchestia longiramus]